MSKRQNEDYKKYILKLIDRKKKKLKNNDNEFIHFFYKDSLNDLNDIKNLNSEYESKRHQRSKESLSSVKKKFEINIKKRMLKR